MGASAETYALSKFYTPSWLGLALVSSLGKHNPRSILDLGCGAGALATAARQRWKRAEIITVDIDRQSRRKLLGLQSAAPHLHRHVVADALDPHLGDRAQLQAGSVDLAICNPPFQRPRWRPSFGHILEAAGLSHVVRASGDVTSDLLFIAQNMRYLSNTGGMGLIVPDAIVTGEKMIGVRKALACQIEKIIQLPRTAFSNTEAQTFILIISRRKRDDTIELQEITSEGSYSPPVVVSGEQSYCRLDYRFHAANNLATKKGLRTLKDLEVQIRRGNLSSVEARHSRWGTFHTSDFDIANDGSLFLSSKAIAKHVIEEGISAKRGDILIARVDRKLESKIGIVRRGEAILSDCVYRLRCPAKNRPRVLRGLKSAAGKKQLCSLSRGNGARHISIASLLTVLV